MNDNYVTEVANSALEFDRIPPHDKMAEESVLGSMLQSKDAIGEVAEIIRGEDFYYPTNEIIYDIILDLYAKGEPADAITVKNRLEKDGLIKSINSADYLHNILVSVPTPASAVYYARIVEEKALLRRLVTAGTRIVQIGYSTNGADTKDLVDNAQSEIYAVSARRNSTDYAPVSDIINDLVNRIMETQDSNQDVTGLATGFRDFDNLTSGLHPGQMIIVAARPGMGKALALDTLIPTPDGMTTMEKIAVGDKVIDHHGNPTNVVAVTEVLHNRPCYQLIFSNGEKIIADANHQWQVQHQNTCQLYTTKTLNQLFNNSNSVQLTIQMPALSNLEKIKIVSVTAVPSQPVKCIQVSSPDHLYLASASYIPTHNSTLALDFCRHASIKLGKTSCIFSLEMSKNELTLRLLAAEAKVSLNHLRNGKMTEDDWSKLSRCMGNISAAPLFIDDSPNLTMTEISAKARRIKQNHDLSLIVVDYLQLMTSGKRVESRQQEVSEFSRALKLLAKDLEVPLIAVAQLNRGPEQRGDKMPMLSDLRESGSLEQDADLVVILHREDYYNSESSRPGEADIIVAKHRNGRTDTLAVAFQGQYSRFADLGGQ